MRPFIPTLEADYDLVWTPPASLTPDQFDVLIHKAQPALEKPSNLLLDLRNVIYLDTPCLLQVVALYKWAVEAKHNLYLALPESPRVRDFLRAWRLQPALRAATGIPMYQLVPREQIEKYFGEKQTFYLGRLQRAAGSSSSEAYERLLSDRFFALLPHHRDASIRRDSIVRTEWARWQNPYVMSVLENHLKGPAQEIPRVVIYELISNAVQHPKSALMLTTSRALGLSGDSPKIKQLTICVWDDGDTIASTLRRSLDSGRPIRQSPRPEQATDLFEIHAQGWEPPEPVRSSAMDPTKNDVDEILLLSSLFDGVSEFASADPAETPVGSGLTALYHTAINALGGTLSVRSGLDFMNVKAHPDGRGTYKAKLERFPGIPFTGNLITVRIPLR